MLPRLPRVLLAFALLSVAATAAQPPADPALNPKGRAILAWFQALQASPDLKLVSGQFAGWSGSSAKMEVLAKIERATGQWPAMIGLDYCGWDAGAAAIHTGPANELAKEYWRDGGLVTISWHAPNPANPKGGGLNDKGVNLADLLAPGETHDRWMKSLDKIAAGLQELQEAGVVVIWRPFHEMNGGWFWWGAQVPHGPDGRPDPTAAPPDPANLIAAWRHMFNYFTHEKNLHNLIWSYGPNHGQPLTAGYYAGDAFVDLVGLDAYTDLIDPAHIKGFEPVIALGKPAGLTEYGPHGASNPPGDYDYRRLLDGVAQNFPQLRFFMSWDAKWNPAENLFAKEFYNDPRVITRAALPAALAGK